MSAWSDRIHRADPLSDAPASSPGSSDPTSPLLPVIPDSSTTHLPAVEEASPVLGVVDRAVRTELARCQRRR